MRSLDFIKVWISEDMFLYAVWKEEILVTFDANGGYYYGEYWDEGFEHAVNPEVIQRRPGENGIDGEVMCPKPVIRNMDLAFAGWSYEKDGEVVYEEDQWWIPIEETVTLYAVWKDAYAVTMDANGGYYMGYWDEITHTDVQEGTDKIVQKVVKGKSLSIRRPDSYNESEGLWGFSLEKDGEVVLLNDNYSYGEDTNRYTPDGNCTLYAVWKPAAEITLDANGGYYIYLYDDSDNNLTINKEYIIPGTRMHLPDERDVQYEGDEKELKGWSLTRNGNLVGEDDDPFAYTPSGKCTLYAIWSGDEVKVSSILLNYSEMSVVKGVSQQVSVQVFPDDATVKSIIWSSRDEKIAKVDKNGKVTGVGAGTATITALAADGSGVAAECNVIVIAKTITMTDVSAISYNKLNVSWEKCDDADGYLVYRKGNGEAYTLVKSLNREDSTSFTNSVVSGAKYTYKVSAYKMDGKKKVILAQTGEMSGTALPAAPVMKSTGMAAFNKIKVIWTKVSGCAGYVIYRSTEEDGQYTVLKTVTMATATEYSNIVQDGQTYYYKIRAFVEVNGKKVYGDYSEVLSGDVIDAPPANFRLEQKTSTKIIFNWDKVDDAEGYVIYRYFPDTNKCKAIKNISSKDTLTYSYKVDADTDYQFTMRAFRVVNGKKVYSDYTERISN